MREREHAYLATIVWDGNTGSDTASYSAYSRRYRILVAGKPELPGSADPAFRGDSELHNPEDLFLASLGACHMLTYLALCAAERVLIASYEDDVEGKLRLNPDGGGRLEEVRLRPRVLVRTAGSRDRAERLHDEAHRLCFIAASCGIPIAVEPIVEAC